MAWMKAERLTNGDVKITWGGALANGWWELNTVASQYGYTLVGSSGASGVYIISRASMDFWEAGSYKLYTIWYNSAGKMVGSPVALNIPAWKPVIMKVQVTRVSDSSQKVTWETVAPLKRAIVQRREWAGTTWSAIKQVGAPSGNIRSFVDTTTQAGRAYEYRVAGVIEAQGDFSGWSNEIYTTPLAPSNVTVERLSLSQARVTWKIQGVGTFLPRVERQVDGGDWVQVAALGANTQAWTDTAFPQNAASVKYRVRCAAKTPTSLLGAYSTPSPAIAGIAVPNAPLELVPDGEMVLRGDAEPLRWVYSASDFSQQSAAEARVRLAGGVWQTLTAATEQQVEFTPAEAGEYEWQVRTKGVHASWGPWSAIATFTAVDQPMVAIQSPEGNIQTSMLSVVWAFSQEQGLPQSSWEVLLLDASGEVLESDQGASRTTVLQFRHLLQNHEQVEIRVRAAAGALWSEWVSTFAEGEFREPLPPTLDVTWDDARGCHVVVFDAEFTLPAEVENEGDGVFTFTIGDTGLEVEGENG